MTDHLTAARQWAAEQARQADLGRQFAEAMGDALPPLDAPAEPARRFLSAAELIDGIANDHNTEEN